MLRRECPAGLAQPTPPPAARPAGPEQAASPVPADSPGTAVRDRAGGLAGRSDEARLSGRTRTTAARTHTDVAPGGADVAVT